MSTKLIIYLIILFFALLFLGFGCNFLLFRQDRDEKKSKHFFTSERLLVFFIEILIAVIGFGVTLFITNAYERQVEKDKALQMLEQVVVYTENQVIDERNYLRMYDKGEIKANVFLNSSVVNTDYYESILTNEFILQNANMKTHGEIMRYLVWIEQSTTLAKEATDESYMRAEMYWRYAYFLKFYNLLAISYDELNSTITEEEAAELCEKICQRSLNDEIKVYESAKK
ncbi:MAG: hypothetical protein IJF40_03465 [Clostridia bacterium]|nr:hypothetical protein [Clostridia bacterium]